MNLEKLAKSFLADRLAAGVRYFGLVEDLKKNAKRKVKRTPNAPEEGVSQIELIADISKWCEEKAIDVPEKGRKWLAQSVDNNSPKELRGEAADAKTFANWMIGIADDCLPLLSPCGISAPLPGIRHGSVGTGRRDL